MAQRSFDPWRAVADLDEVRLTFDPVARLMGGGFHVRRGDVALIVLDPDLDDDLARVVLTHELVHHERGGGVDQRGRPPALATVAQREEAAVEREVARRLVPVDELAELVHEVVANGGGVGAGEVSAYFAVPPDVAALALQGLRASWPGLDTLRP